jgi:hypothetical protein
MPRRTASAVRPMPRDCAARWHPKSPLRLRRRLRRLRHAPCPPRPHHHVPLPAVRHPERPDSSAAAQPRRRPTLQHPLRLRLVRLPLPLPLPRRRLQPPRLPLRRPLLHPPGPRHQSPRLPHQLLSRRHPLLPRPPLRQRPRPPRQPQLSSTLSPRRRLPLQPPRPPPHQPHQPLQPTVPRLRR